MVVVKVTLEFLERRSTLILLGLIMALAIVSLVERRERVQTNSRNVTLLQEQQKVVAKQQSDIFALIFRVDALSDETHSALCGIKRDYTLRAARLRRALRLQRGPQVLLSGLMVSRSSVISQLRVRDETLESLSVLTCGGR